MTDFNKAVRLWLAECPAIRADRLYFNYLTAGDGKQSFQTVEHATVREDICGNEIGKYSFAVGGASLPIRRQQTWTVQLRPPHKEYKGARTMANTIKLTEGLEPLDIVFEDRGEVVRIRFNPRDTDLALRIMQSQENIRAAVSALPEGEDDTAKLESVNGVIRDEIDRIFGASVSNEVFRFCGPLTPDKDGVTFVERFLAAVTPYIIARIEEANKASAARIAKHTAKYTGAQA